ncbi:MAG: hypothetical protein AAF547_11075 [Actinomycetota bacterium]
MHVSHAEQPGPGASASSAAGGAFGTLHVLGGRQRNPAGLRELDTQWYGYGMGVVVRVGDGAPETVETWSSRPGTFGPDDPILFKSAYRRGDLLYACSQTEAMVFDYPSFQLRHHVSLPVFNDVHHVIPGGPTADTAEDDRTLLAAVSGQDAVVEFTVDGELVRVWAVDGSDPTDRIDPERDYRINTKLKPHAFHPNHVFRMPDGSAWVTRFETRDAVQIDDVSRRIAIDQERCHDGVVDGGQVHFTTVDGHVVSADVETLEVVGNHRLERRREDSLLGWCRGLTFVGDHAIVGFSRIRHTKVRGALSFIRTGFSVAEPTRIAVYDRRTWRLEEEIDLEPAGCNAVFTIVQEDAGLGGDPRSTS